MARQIVPLPTPLGPSRHITGSVLVIGFDQDKKETRHALSLHVLCCEKSFCF